MSDDVVIIVRADNGQAIRAFRDVNGQLRDMRGRFVSEGAAMSGAMNRVSASIGGVRGALIPLATAAVPLAAALAPVAAKAGAAGLAVGAFGAAVAGQISSLSAATKAQDAYNKAAFQHGAGSKQAAEAARTAAATFEAMPVATARAAVALGTLKDGFREVSDETASFTMVPVEKSFTVLGQMLPKLTPMAKGAASQLNRLVTVAGGAVASPGFDALSEKVSAFANESLKDAVDGIIHFARALSEGDADGPVKAFMDYAEANGPALKEALASVGDAVSTLVEGAAEAGPGMLTLVNAAAGLVAAMPPELVTVLMQTALGLKAVTLAGAGAAAIGTGVTALGTSIAGLQAASAAAGGGMAGLAAAFGTLGKAAKASVVVGGIAVVALTLNQLSKIGKDAPPDIDKMTTSLGNLAQTGKLSGEAARVFGEDYDKLGESLRTLAKPSNLDKFQQNLTQLIGMDSTPVKDAKEDFSALDESLTALVKGGKAGVAKAALDEAIKGLKEQGFTSDQVKAQVDGYTSALADMALEQQLTAQSMGVFGTAALDTSGKLAAQKTNADSLRQAIFALNDVNRSAHDAQTQFEESLDSLTASFAEHGATLNRDTEAGRANRDAMSAAAAAQQELIVTGVAAGESLASMTQDSAGLREEMMRLATDAFGGNKRAAEGYVNTLLGTPESVTTAIKLERETAIAGLVDVQTAIAATPDAKEVRVDTLSAAAIGALEKVGLKTEQLPDGKTRVYTANGSALGNISAVATALNNLNGKRSTTYVDTVYTQTTVKYNETRQPRSRRHGGLAPGYAGGGHVQSYPNGGLISGPGTSTSDSILMLPPGGGMYRASDKEYIVQASAVQKYGVGFLDRLNSKQLKVSGYAKGGLTDAQKEARKELASSFNISRFGSFAGYKRDSFEKGLGAPQDLGALVSSLNELRGQIKAAFSGKAEKTLLKNLDMWGKGLIKWEKQLSKVSKSLETAKAKLDSLKDAAASLASGVKGGVLSSANITKGVSGDAPTTVASIMGGLTASRDKASAFSKALKDLQKMGLSSALIQQIAEAGVEGGGLETAGALLGASSSEIQSMNDLQKQINSSATSAGKTAADAVYGKAIDAQTKVVKDLTASQEKLEKSMATLAKNIEKLLQQALKGKASGGIVGAAAAGGLKSNLTWVGENGPELLDLAPGSRVWSNPDSQRMAAAPWASMLNAPRSGSTAARRAAAYAGGGSDGQPLVIQLQIGKRDLGEIVVDTLRGEVRARGSIEATLKPPRGR